MIMNMLLMGIGLVTLSVGGGIALTYACWIVGRIFNTASSDSVEQLQDRYECPYRSVAGMKNRERLIAERVKALEDAAPPLKPL